MTRDQVIAMLEQQANVDAVQGMARFGIRPAHALERYSEALSHETHVTVRGIAWDQRADSEKGSMLATTALGISIPVLRKMAREIGKNHLLAQELWDSGRHEARILASMIADPHLVSPQQMEAWVNDFDSWDVCDQVCGNLFDRTPYAYQKAIEWPHREQEFVRRAGFVMMAELAVHDKQAPDESFLPFFPLIKQYAVDERNFVKKAVNWALRQIGKRNSHLRTLAIEQAEAIKQMDSKAAQWVAKDALRELQKTVAQ